MVLGLQGAIGMVGLSNSLLTRIVRVNMVCGLVFCCTVRSDVRSGVAAYPSEFEV
jgi:hypothetical protein